MFISPHPFNTLVTQILVAKKKDPDANTSALERQIDQKFTNSTTSRRRRLQLWRGGTSYADQIFKAH